MKDQEFHLVGWLNADLKITRLSVHDCPPYMLTRKFNVPPPMSLLVVTADSLEEAWAYFRKNAEHLLGEKLAQMLSDKARP